MEEETINSVYQNSMSCLASLNYLVKVYLETKL